MQFVIFALIVALIIGLALISGLQAKKRRAELQQWAATRGLSFSEVKDSLMDDRYPTFSCLRQGDNRYAYNIMQGTFSDHEARGTEEVVETTIPSPQNPFRQTPPSPSVATPAHGRSILAFDYHYATHSTNSKGHRTTYHHSFSAVIANPGLPLRPLSIRGETFFDKVGAFMGFEDINFESAEFNRQFFVKSPDRRWAFDVLNQHSLEFLLASPRFSLEMDDACAIAFRNKTFSTGDFESALGVLGGLLDRIPHSVLQEMKRTGE